MWHQGFAHEEAAAAPGARYPVLQVLSRLQEGDHGDDATNICAVVKVRNEVMSHCTITKEIIDCDISSWVPGVDVR